MRYLALGLMLVAGLLVAAKPVPSLSSLTVIGLPWDTGNHVDAYGVCYGEDAMPLAYVYGDLAPGQSAPAALPRVCTPNGGGLAFRVSATMKGNSHLVASIVRPDGTVVTHGAGLVCLSDTLWYFDPSFYANPYGIGALPGGVYTLVVQNVGTGTAHNVSIVYSGAPGYTLDSTCPAADILYNGQ